MAITLDGTNGINSSGVIVAPDGSASAPAITNDGDTNTGIFFPAADTIAFAEGGVEAMRIDSSGRVGVGTTSPNQTLVVKTANGGGIAIENESAKQWRWAVGSDSAFTCVESGVAERMRIDSSGRTLLGTTSTTPVTSNTFGVAINASAASGAYAAGVIQASADGSAGLSINRGTDDGTLVNFAQAGTVEGSISVSGSTVSYNGGHLSRWAQMLTKPDLLKGTVMSNLDEMNVYVDADGNPVENEQLNKVKVSDVEGDANVAGVFVNWTYDEAHQVDEINMAMTGDMIIRIAEGVTVARGDLLMSAGDGTAKPQGDDIVRSKTIAKVTSTHVTCTYDDGSYCVPCVLMAC